MGIANGNRDIISKIDRSATARNGSLSVDWGSLIGLLPFGNNFTNAVTFFNSISYTTDSRTSNILDYHESVSENEATYGKSVRGHTFSLDSNEYLASEDDGLRFDYTVCVPTDKPRTTGLRTVYHKYEFKVYSRNGWGFYTVLEDSIDKTISKSYQVQ